MEAKFLGPRAELTSEPCYKKLKSDAFSHHGGPDSHRIQEKSGNNWDPTTIIDVRGCSSEKDRTRTTDSLKPARKPDVSEAVGSQVLQDGGPSFISRDDDIYSTSKAFIGPIYKPPGGKKSNKRKKETDTLKGRPEEKPKSKQSEIDTELTQFYKEIEELENDKEAPQDSCKEPELSQQQVIPYHQGYNDDLFNSHEENQGLENTLLSHRGFHQYFEHEAGKYPCGEPPLPTFCDFSFSSFRPEWQSMHPFLLPHSPPPPSFNYHLDIQRFSAPPNPPPNIFPAPEETWIPNGCCVNSYPDNKNCLTFDPSHEYANYTENSSSVHPLTNGYSVQDGFVSNGFCEIREGCWEDPFLDKHDGPGRSVSQQFQEEKLNKLQKLLILLRGLPGSGKTTLSRILLGQSRDGIVFSTDDYFRHQDGYRYNVNQLGDAHDWNQNRAKQAINQGRSPVIIDNTNTQAWEMKPYVEMAIGKGYRVEFHEPETWWKFDPEELEKRNKHGVSRKKIAQMLDRYEYHVSISIVMNSVEPPPPQKSSPRPLPLQGTQRERVLKKSGHSFGKTKRKRNRNKKHNVLSEFMSENSFENLSYLTPGDSDPPQSEEEDCEETRKEPRRPVTAAGRKEIRDLVNGCKEKHWKSPDYADSFQNALSRAELNLPPKKSLPQQEGDLHLTEFSVPDGSSAAQPTGTPHHSCVARDGYTDTKVEKRMGNRQKLTLDTQGIFAGSPHSFMKKVDMVDASLPDEPVLCLQQGSKASEKVLKEEQAGHAIQNNFRDFFTTNLSDKALQLGSESQSCFGIWPEGPHKFVCEQRPKKDRSRRLVSPESREELIKLISPSEGASEPASNPEVLREETLLIENEELSLIPATSDSFKDTETTVFGSCMVQLDIPECTFESTKKKQRLLKRIFNWPSDVNSLGQTLTDVKEREKSGPFPENHRADAVLGGGNSISEINSKEDKKQTIMTFDHHLFDLDIVKDCPLSIGQCYSHYLSFNRLGNAVYFYKNPVSSLVLHYISSFWMVSFNNGKTFLTFKSQRRVGNRLTDVGIISSGILSSQPNILCSLRVTSDM